MMLKLGVLLLLVTIVLCQPANVAPWYRKFIEQHINTRMSADRCDAEITRRGIAQTNSNDCKETNTFIRANTGVVRSVCGNAGVRDGGFTRSLQPFDLVVCKLRNQGARLPRCNYRGQITTRYIKIKCEQGYPVHFEGDIMLVD
ncbi:ribonuclease [Oryzias melastigma]|uniref:ribonuclease n=1 Tax=Oryzias melastigma TaxID=30732 RepID=UPI00168D56DE|nr:ribonuclease [Oryzias melastigma]